MVDLEYLAFLENILTDNRKERFLQVLSKRTNHFTIAMEDIFQLHNTSAVMRSCEVFGIQQLNVIESVILNLSIRKLQWARRNGLM
jgi:tRNA (guanosine-2'-O-)-methyltransferase